MTVIFQKNLDHYSAATPVSIDVHYEFQLFMVKGKYCATYPGGVNLSRNSDWLLEFFSF